MNQKAIVFLLLLAWSSTAVWSQNTTIKLNNRFSLGKDKILPLRVTDAKMGFLYYGTSIAIRKSKNENKFQEFETGLFYSKNRVETQDLDLEVFFRYQTNLFKKLMNKPGLKLYFSLGPRLFYAREDINSNAVRSPLSERTYYGLEVPIIFNVDFHLTERLSIGLNTNVISLAYYSEKGSFNNPNLTDRQNSIGVTNVIMRTFNELRIGVGYELSN